MLEVTIVFTVFALFFLFLYVKLRGERKERLDRQDQGIQVEPIGYIEKSYPFLCVSFAVICLFVAYSSAVLGEATVTETVTHTYGNFTYFDNGTIMSPQIKNTTTIVYNSSLGIPP